MWDRDRRRSGHRGIAWTLQLVEEGDRHAPPSSRVPMRSRYNYNVNDVLFSFHNDNTFDLALDLTSDSLF